MNTIEQLTDPFPQQSSAALSTAEWLTEGVRAGLFLKPRVSPLQQPGAGQLLVLFILISVLQVGLARFEVAGPAQFSLRGMLVPHWSTALLLLLAWWMLPRVAADNPGAPAGLAAWFALWMGALLPAQLVSQLIAIAYAQEALPASLAARFPWTSWSVYILLVAWMIGAGVVLAARFGVTMAHRAALALGLLAIIGVSGWQVSDRPWHVDYSQSSEAEPPRLELSQETFESQQAIWSKAVNAIAPQRAGVTDVYGLVFAPYASEDVFLRESTMVATLLAERFDAAGRVLHLVNNTATTATHPWATALNLERAVQALAGRMDRENDLLFVYLTSHGASDHKLSAWHDGLKMHPVSPEELRAALDKAGVKHRVIAVSACYSGGWIAPLAGESSLVMTAADATHTSYGCGRLSELTYFGRAVFGEQLRQTRSLEKAFAAAVPLIKQREIDAGKSDGFSNPQISVGGRIRPLLRELEQRLEALP